MEKSEELLMLKLPVELNVKMIKPSTEEPPQLELKVLPEKLKYAFLGAGNTASYHFFQTDSRSRTTTHESINRMQNSFRMVNYRY